MNMDFTNSKSIYNIEKIKEYLRSNLSEHRYLHSENTAATAEALARLYKADSNKAYIAGLVHDCTRELDMDTQQQLISLLKIEVDKLTLSTRELLHAYTAEYVMKTQFEIFDEEIISAVRYHTTGKENMAILEKIVFLADVIEPTRSFPGVDNIRALSKENLNMALIAAFDSSIRYLIGKEAEIHPNTFFARNYILSTL
jgi:predicted HD superfamily hydrolase involved in NAD metabolism